MSISILQQHWENKSNTNDVSGLIWENILTAISAAPWPAALRTTVIIRKTSYLIRANTVAKITGRTEEKNNPNTEGFFRSTTLEKLQVNLKISKPAIKPMIQKSVMTNRYEKWWRFKMENFSRKNRLPFCKNWIFKREFSRHNTFRTSQNFMTTLEYYTLKSL